MPPQVSITVISNPNQSDEPWTLAELLTAAAAASIEIESDKPRRYAGACLVWRFCNQKGRHGYLLLVCCTSLRLGHWRAMRLFSGA